jgi:hypothetical protein
MPTYEKPTLRVESYTSMDDFEALLRGIIKQDPAAVSQAAQTIERIEKDRAYIEFAECGCVQNSCQCYLPIELDQDRIQSGDTISQFIPAYGKEIRLHVLGVRHWGNRPYDPDSYAEVCTSGWPAAIVRVRDGVKLDKKGKGITKEELRHRRRQFGGGWDDEL